MRSTVLVFAGLITALLILFRIGRYSLFSGDLRTEILLAVTALAFLGIGLLLRRQQLKVIPVTEESNSANPAQLKALAITARELEVLTLVAEGLSNREIGKRLFLSESTVKTHVSNLLSKLEAKRRTQAVERARILKIL